MNQDEKNLDLLGILHYVMGGFAALAGFIPLFHLGFGIAILSGFFNGQDAPPALVGWIFILFAVVFILITWTMAVLLIVSGKRLRQRRSHTFCLVVAAILCLNVPLGTILGVFTIVTLLKDSVKELFISNSKPV